MSFLYSRDYCCVTLCVFQTAILKIMSNQSEINNNTVEDISWGVEEGLQTKCVSREEKGPLLENGGTSSEIEGSVNEQQVVFGDHGAGSGTGEDENSCLEVDGKVKEFKVEEVGANGDEILASKRDAGDADCSGTEESKEARSSLENMKVNFMEDFEVPPVGGKVREVEVTDDSSSEMNSVVEFSGSAVKNRDENVDEVSRLLAALRALCTSANTDVVLICGAWQMRAHSEVLRARSHALSEMLGISDGQLCRTIKVRLNMDPGALGIAVNYMYFNEVRRIGNTSLNQGFRSWRAFGEHKKCLKTRIC